MRKHLRVWDLPTRLFHWTLVLVFVSLIVSGERAGDALVWHMRLGYAALSLVAFRILWGFIGGYWSRFSRFIYSPKTTWRYIQGASHLEHPIGHNPLGALSVFGLLLGLTLQITAGLFADDEISTTGPLATLAPEAWVKLATWYHTGVGKGVLITLATLHICAILYYRWKHDNDLITPMLTGDKQVETEAPASSDSWKTRLLAACTLLLCIGFAYYLVNGR